MNKFLEDKSFYHLDCSVDEVFLVRRNTESLDELERLPLDVSISKQNLSKSFKSYLYAGDKIVLSASVDYSSLFNLVMNRDTLKAETMLLGGQSLNRE